MSGNHSLNQLAKAGLTFIRGREAWIVFTTALVARLAQVFIASEHPTDDTADYDEIARNLLSGEGFVSRENWFGFDVYSWRAPAHPFLLAAIYYVFGFGHTAPMIVQAVIGAVATVVVYDLGRHLHPSSAFVAGMLAALYGPLIRATSTLATEPLFILLTVAAVHQLTLGRSTRLPQRSVHLSFGTSLTQLAPFRSTLQLTV